MNCFLNSADPMLAQAKDMMASAYPCTTVMAPVRGKFKAGNFLKTLSQNALIFFVSAYEKYLG